MAQKHKEWHSWQVWWPWTAQPVAPQASPPHPVHVVVWVQGNGRLNSAGHKVAERALRVEVPEEHEQEHNMHMLVVLLVHGVL